VPINKNLNIKIGLSGIPVVFLHAFPVNQKMWFPQMDMLRKNNLDFVSVDYPGFGESPLIKNGMDMTDYGEIIFDLLQQLDVRKAVFVGLSMGGYVALALFRKHRELFSGLVLANTRASSDSKEARNNRFRIIETLRKKGDPTFVYDLHTDKFFTPQTRQKNPALVSQVYQMMTEATVEGIIQAQQAMAERFDSIELLGEINIPVLIISGINDPIISLTETMEMAKKCPQASLEIIENAAHLSNLEKAEEFNHLLLEYLQKIIT
jgi:3-oxoadipate enol-lactonase